MIMESEFVMNLTSIGLFTDKSKTASQTRDKLAALGLEWFNRCQGERVKQERQWYLNLAFFGGNQYVQFRSTSANGPYDLYIPQAPPWRVRVTVNQIRKAMRREMARLTAQKPNAFIVPSSSEDADIFAAQAGEQIWDSLWRRLKFNKTLRQAVFWQTICGNGFLKSYWDQTLIDPESNVSAAVKPIPTIGMDPDETGVPTGPIYGDIVIKEVSPFHVLVPDLMCINIEDQPYIIHAEVKSNYWVEQNLGINASDQSLHIVDEPLRNVLGVNRNNTKKDQTIILEVWVKPGYLPELPDGGMFTIASNSIVQGFDQWPYSHGQYPLVKLDSIPSGKFYTASVIEDLIPLQRELNRTRSQIIEAKNRMAKPQLSAQEGSVDAKKITTEPGQLIFYKIGFDPPQPLPMQSLPSYVTEEVNRLYADISDIVGQHDVSNGGVPPGVTAATAISFLQEQDETIVAWHFNSIEESIETVAQQCLTFVKDYWDEPRTVKIAGIDGTFDVQVFKGSDLRGNADIRVESGSALPTSRAAKQAFLLDLMKMGFIPPEEGLEMMEVGGLNKIYERTQIDRRQAQRENLKMRVVTEQDVQSHMEEWQSRNPEVQKDSDTGLQLTPPLVIPVNTYDNHAIHIEEHNRYRKSQNFESAPPVTKILFEEHVRQHMEAVPVSPDSLPGPAVSEKDIELEQGQNPGPEPMPSDNNMEGGQ